MTGTQDSLVMAKGVWGTTTFWIGRVSGPDGRHQT
jgi:hypothetical protein